MQLGRSSIGALLGVLLFSVNAHAQLDLVQPECMPEWWVADQVASALDVELGPRSLRVTFVVDEPCSTGTIVSVLVEGDDGRRRRSIDLGDLPAQARPRAIAMGVAALLRAPAESSETPTAVTAGETAGAEIADEPPRDTATPPSSPEVDEVDELDAEPPAANEVVDEPLRTEPAPVAPPRLSEEPGPSEPTRRPWELGLAGVGLWTSSRTPWFGASGSFEYQRPSGWSLRAGVDGARTDASDALGTVRGRLVAGHVGVGWRYRWRHVDLGARAAVVAEWIHLSGRSADESVQTESRARWSGSGELAALFAVPLGARVAITGDVGVRVTPWGLSARSPSGTALAITGASGLARLGLSIRLP